MEEMYFITLNEAGTILRHPHLEKPNVFSSDVIECRLCGAYHFLRELNISYVKPYWMLFCEKCIHDLRYHRVTELSQFEALRSSVRVAIEKMKKTKAYEEGEFRFPEGGKDAHRTKIKD